MIVIACVDDNMGMAFNHRRQSRDAILCRDVLSLAPDTPLWMHPYSASLFPDAPKTSIADADYLTKAGADDLCFVEREDVSPYAAAIHTVILYRWNRHYPADTYFALDWKNYRKIETVSLEGKSHPEITREIWKHR
ncbi:MAG: ribonuclease Z [Eubacteriales bacterium]|nr:ribonuclease Z [Eubacteriales bacterium]